MIKSDGNVGVSKSWIKWGKLKDGITSKRCAKLICIGASNKINEIWITKQPDLMGLYFAQQFPNLYASNQKIAMQEFPPFLDKVRRSKL